jgi:hypothetical protein
MSDRYFGCVRDVKDGADETAAPAGSSAFGLFKAGTTTVTKDDKEETLGSEQPTAAAAANTFAQRYMDEVAPSTKMREYDTIASKQKEALVKEARILKAKFSEEIQESQKMERTVNNISSMISEFVQLIESQSAMVDTIGEVSQDTSASVKSADAELLLTLERSQSHQWSMLLFIAGMACLLLLLDFMSP